MKGTMMETLCGHVRETIYDLGGDFKAKYQKDGILVIFNSKDSKEAFYLSEQSQETLKTILTKRNG